MFYEFTTEIGTHSRHAQKTVCVILLKNLQRVPSRGVDPRIKFLYDADATQGRHMGPKSGGGANLKLRYVT